ncbi:MAG: DNA topoisomerase (ATP-hydrolyzing) [Planctomycetales bacterium]
MARKKSAARGANGNAAATNGNGLETDRIRYVSLSDETRRRYLNYAISVITSRALPDVRDGLKPVQRRILYAMYHDLHLRADGKTLKTMKICGDTMGNYHPHGDAAIYDTLVRLGQPFTMRYVLIAKQGNFGSVMGLPPAAARYTEAKLTDVAEQLMDELRFGTVDMRPNYLGNRDEPVVLPARFPNLLVNGTQGIAVGMATNIPPHNLREVVAACIHLIRHPDATVPQLMKHLRGPDFPLGGRIVTDRRTITQAYKDGRGAIKVRADWKLDRERRGQGENAARIIITSVPYGVSTGPLQQELGAIAGGRKLPQLLGVGDETDDQHGLRLVLEIKPGADPDAVMAYLFKHSQLEQNFNLNLTCLVPDERGNLVPARLPLEAILKHFLDFRFATIKRRFEYQLEVVERRIHVLEGFEIVFQGLDKALAIIRKSQGKEDAAAKLMAEFPLDPEQTNAVLDMQLYKISSLEIDRIRAELREKRKEAERIRAILASNKQLWKVVQEELQETAAQFGDDRRTSIGSSDEIAEYDPQAYIVRENTNVVVTRDGWIKRVGRLTSVEGTRTREGDEVLDVVPGNTLDHVVFFASHGVAYTLAMQHVPPSTGYGEPLSKHVRLDDGVSIIAALSTDPRFTPPDQKVRKEPTLAPHLLVATAQGQVMRLPLSGFRTPSTRAGRKFCRLRKGDRVVFIELVRDAETMFLATKKARVLHCPIAEVPVLAAAGKGVRGIKLEAGDEVLCAMQLARPSDALHVINENGKQLSFGQMKYNVTSRGGKGVKTSTRTSFVTIVRPEIQLVDWSAFGEEGVGSRL